MKKSTVMTLLAGALAVGAVGNRPAAGAVILQENFDNGFSGTTSWTLFSSPTSAQVFTIADVGSPHGNVAVQPDNAGVMQWLTAGWASAQPDLSYSMDCRSGWPGASGSRFVMGLSTVASGNPSSTTGYALYIADSPGYYGPGNDFALYRLSDNEVLAVGSTGVNWVANDGSDKCYWHTVTLNRTGNQLVGYVDGTSQLFSVTDATSTAFKGIFFGGNEIAKTAQFDNLLVTAPIPEPACLGLLALGGLVLARRRR